MFLSFNKKSIMGTILFLIIAIMVGCSSGAPKSASDNASANKSQNAAPQVTNSEQNSSNTSSGDGAKNSSNTSSNTNVKTDSKNNNQKALINTIKTLAQQGKVINSDFSLGINMASVEQKWGKADKSEWIAQAKGIYISYSKHNIVFGTNKGAQIFEIRSLDSRPNQISFSTLKNVLGKPAYDVKSNGEEIIGYKANTKYKILFVFSEPKKGNENPSLKHYSVLYPSITANSMASDPGREW
ncbi:YjgB family protein [Clostridium sp. 19966]|uniref:YjgB family protein n=1 Tax=Clostridium sp. 19966 TaxID=2768166 RepID=UPI0028E04858|nr:YjgB family protein [Clostridium sp. 19966]MDT8715159.1 YjgB family protein [Clostridium sp. 19966]